MFIFRLNYSRPLSALICLALILTFSSTLQQAEAQEPGEFAIFLPLLMKGDNNDSPTAGPYAQMLNKVQQRCASASLNQFCTANGQVTIRSKTGAVTVSQPGTIADLTTIQSLSLTSSGPDSGQWSLAWLRLRADSGTPEQELTILAFGNVQISNIILFEGQTNPDDATTLPSLQFASSPVAGVTKLGSSGLIVTNPTQDDLLSLTLNSAAITLGSTALIEAQPGDKMTLTMATGSSLTESNSQSSTAIQNQQVSVPLSQNGNVSGSPTPAYTLEDDEHYDQVLDDLLKRLMDRIMLANAALSNLNQAIDRCIEGRATYVYNVLYWTRVIETTPGLKSVLDLTKLSQAYSRAPNCLSFEVEFDSTVTTTNPNLYESSHVHTDGLPVQFLVDGRFIAINTNLDYLSYVYQPTPSCGSITTQKTPGELELAAGSLKIAGNKVRISMTLRVVKQPTDVATLICPPAPPLVTPHDHWVVVFYNTHEDLWQKPDPSFRFNDWKYTGGEHFGEVIYERTRTGGEFTFDATTYLILVHTPLK